MTREVKVGIIGSGAMAAAHVIRLQKTEGCKIVACVDIDPERATKLASGLGAAVYKTVEDMLTASEVDAIFVCTPPFARGLEIPAIEKGIPVFFEKPVALTANRAKEIERQVRKSGIIESVGYMWRYLDVTDQAIRQIQESGPVSMVVGQYVDAFWWPKGHWWLYKEKGGGQVVESSTHVFDLIRFLVGDVARVYAEIDNLLMKQINPDMTSEDSSIVLLRFNSGAMGVVFSSCASRNTFTGGSVKLIAKDVVLEHGGHSKVLRIYKTNVIEEHRSQLDFYLEEEKVFIDAVRSGDTSKIRSRFPDAVKTLELTLAANESASQKKAVNISR